MLKKEKIFVKKDNSFTRCICITYVYWKLAKRSSAPTNSSLSSSSSRNVVVIMLVLRIRFTDVGRMSQLGKASFYFRCERGSLPMTTTTTMTMMCLGTTLVAMDRSHLCQDQLTLFRRVTAASHCGPNVMQFWVSLSYVPV